MKSTGVMLWKDARRWLPGVVISVVALALVFRLSNWKDLGAALSAVTVESILLVVVFTLSYLVVRSFAWKVLLEGKISWKQAFLTLNIGYLLNNVFPLRAGEFGRAIVLGKSSGLGMMHVLSSIVIERAFDLFYAAVFLLLTLPLALGMEWVYPVAYTTLGLVVLGMVLLLIMARYQTAVIDLAEKIGQRWAIVQRYVIPQIRSLLGGLNVLTQPIQFVLAFVLIGMSWGVAFIVYYVMIVTFVPGAPFWWSIFADAVLAMGIAIPSAPAALGVFEAALVGGLALLGVANSTALAYAVLMHFMQVAITGVLGFYALAQEGRSIASLFSEARLRR
ncbi:MAG: flippase-like domain-containing protein [Anaerolineae bacterium]|nr:flippase-like domain-containing protein [Anaerolineae bacterium]